MDEVKIAPCLWCQEKETWLFDHHRAKGETPCFQVACPQCGFRWKAFADPTKATEHYNDLCADIDKGRRYDKEVPCSFCGGGQRMPIVEQHLNTAVRLLRESSKQTYIRDNGGVCIASKGYDTSTLVPWLRNRDTFLALDAIKTILKQKGQ